MIVDGVNFNEQAIKGMPKDKFIHQCVDVFWLERPQSVRKKILVEVYERINPPAEEKAEE